MSPPSQSSPDPQPSLKRQRQSSVDASLPGNSNTAGAAQSPNGLASDTAAKTEANAASTPSSGNVANPFEGGKAGQSSNFRNVSACNRCRMRKNRCDQKLPSCASCAKTKVACVGYDPITKREIPRSYVYYLETRLELLEKLLVSNDISFPPAENLDLCSRPSVDAGLASIPDTTSHADPSAASEGDTSRDSVHSLQAHNSKKQNPAMLNIVSPSKPRSLASASGVSFARVVFAAVQYSVSDQNGTSEQPAGSRHPSGGGTSMRDSFFGLHTKPSIQPAPFPDKDVAIRLVTLYFEHANPQIPILHRVEFMSMFEQAYARQGQDLGARELYMLNMVFAIGSGVIVGEPVKTEASGDVKMSMSHSKNQSQPEEYHASAIVHLEACLSNSGGGLEVLQAVLLLANFALLRPVPPGLWYITGVAVRLAVDLGLHHEDGVDVESVPVDPAPEPRQSQREADSRTPDRGKRLWVRDMRRRLWWCTYSFDRLVSTCVGRPFGISDQVITTDLPCLLDDDYITSSGFLDAPLGDEQPSYKHVAHHYFRLRMLQSEILQVLQYNQAQIARGGNAGQRPLYPEMHTHLPCPFLVHFDSFRSWRMDIDTRLYQWKMSAPTRLDTGVAFSTEFLELNYWQAIIMLYRQSLSVPAMFEGEYNTANEVNSPTTFTAELCEDEDRIYLKVAEAGQKILRIYRQLHLSGLVSYTYLSTHHLFTAGISYLYAIWHSTVVRSRLTMDEVDFTVLAAKSVFTDMIEKCPPAETCRDAFDRTARATIKMASSTGGFGVPTQRPRRHRRDTTDWSSTAEAPPTKSMSRHRPHQSEHQPFHFDLSLSDGLSSPSLSHTGEPGPQQTPPAVAKARTFDTDTYMAGPSPSKRTLSQDGPSPMDTAIDPALVPSPAMSRSAARPPPGSNTFMGQQFAVDYPDSNNMDFLQNLGGMPGGELGSMDQSQLDLGFGINWEGIPNDYGEGQQQLNPFDTFFFGGQGSGGNVPGAANGGVNGDDGSANGEGKGIGL